MNQITINSNANFTVALSNCFQLNSEDPEHKTSDKVKDKETETE